MINIDMNTTVMRRQDIDVTDIDGEKVMMNLEKGQYFMLNQIGSRIWDIIDNQCFVKEIIYVLMKEYDVDELTCRQNTIDFLERLSNAELISII